MSKSKNKWVTITPTNKKTLNKKVKDIKSNFALIVRESRISKGYSQAYLADLVGVDRKTINRIENGHFSPNLENIVRIFEVLNVKSQKVFTA